MPLHVVSDNGPTGGTRLDQRVAAHQAKVYRRGLTNLRDNVTRAEAKKSDARLEYSICSYDFLQARLLRTAAGKHEYAIVAAREYVAREHKHIVDVILSHEPPDETDDLASRLD